MFPIDTRVASATRYHPQRRSELLDCFQNGWDPLGAVERADILLLKSPVHHRPRGLYFHFSQEPGGARRQDWRGLARDARVEDAVVVRWACRGRSVAA